MPRIALHLAFSSVLLLGLVATGAAAQEEKRVRIPFRASYGDAGETRALVLPVPGVGNYYVCLAADEPFLNHDGELERPVVRLVLHATREPSGQMYNRIAEKKGPGVVCSSAKIREASDKLHVEFSTRYPRGARGTVTLLRAEAPVKGMRLRIPHAESDGERANPERFIFTVPRAGKYFVLLKVDRAAWDGAVDAEMVPLELSARVLRGATGKTYGATGWQKWLGSVAVEVEITSEEDRIVVEFGTGAPLGAAGLLSIQPI